jgi:Ca2+-binding EF-hand superfamily protein
MINEQSFDKLDTEKTFHDLIHAKAIELFHLCDEEQKGFIIKTDMMRIQAFIGLTEKELEDVFDSFDQSNNGYITFQQFINGFNHYNNTSYNTEKNNELFNKENVEDKIFEETLASLGAQNPSDT